MNIFDKDAQELAEAEQFGGIVSAWVTFSGAVVQLLESYNRGPRGQRYPAEVLTANEALIVIRCAKGPSTREQFAQMMVTISSNLEEHEAVINCKTQRWLKRMGGQIHPGVESETKMRFVLGRGALIMNREAFTPYEAAEKLLGDALLRD